MTDVIWAIPGFLGLSSDWTLLNCAKLKSVDVEDFCWDSLASWARDFNKWITQSENKTENVLMGYSLGGRLALHTLLDQPKNWKAAILISTHPGLSSLEERQTRCQNDNRWAKRFESEEWETVLRDWNGQEVFSKETFVFHRPEKAYKRENLARLLRNGSLGLQDDLRKGIEKLPMPILWVTGQEDSRYQQLSQTLHFSHPLSHCVSIPKAAHRVPWSQPIIFSQILQQFLIEI